MMDLPISPLTGSFRAFSRKVLQKRRFVEPEKKRLSNSLWWKASSYSSPASSRKVATKPSSERSSVVTEVLASTTVGFTR
ncbi:MAG: hypothetical protein BWX47_01931 [candidate division Hyd24-12 bacterium ADurb.Bin004]|nr:MAG: hypothetical protein BWX47_01931 [candidate division Hyd24-12 bacterium ADurb.Bin004]